jgi:hypothetical protein
LAAVAAREVRPIVAILFVLFAATARAQQPSAAVSVAAQVLTGEESRLAGQNRVEPDIGVMLFNPGFRFGTLEVAVSATRRDEQAVLGRSFVHLDCAKLAGLSWTIDAGDAWRMPTLSDFGFTNLFAPPVTFEGVSIRGAGARTQVSVYGGRVTAQQNIFGTDTVPVGQQLYQASASHRVNERLDVYGRGAHVHNGTVEAFPAVVDVSTDVSGGTRYRVTPSVAVLAEAGYAQFRRRGSSVVEHAPSALAGAVWSAPRGWLQLNAHYLPLGYFPAINFPYNDRKGVFAAGEWDAHRLIRLFAGAEFAKTGLDDAAAEAASSGVAPGTQARGYGGVRGRVGDRSLVSVRVEEGGREIRPSNFNGGYESDTGVISADWHAGFERWNAFARYERRENVEPISQGSSFTQHDAAVHAYFSVRPGRQLFAQALLSRRAERSGDGQTLWQLGGGVQYALARWYLRVEGNAGRTSDWVSAASANRQSLSAGLSGQIARHTYVSLDCFIDRSPIPLIPGSPWTTRTLVRVTRSFPFGTARSGALPGSPARSGPTGRIAGLVFADWNGNGQPDADEDSVAGISVTVAGDGSVTSGDDGRFVIANVPVGDHVVSLDLSTLPAQFDAPAEPERAVAIARNRASEVAIGLLPLSSVAGAVFQDTDGDGQLSPADAPITGAVVVLDDGVRTEVSRAGRFRFDAVRMGAHTLALVAESLPDDAQVAGPSTLTASLARNQDAGEIVFLVKVEKRPEVRKVFPPKK